VRQIDLQVLTENLLPAAVELDHRCFGGLWSLDGYRREMDSPNSELLVLLQNQSAPLPIGSSSAPTKSTNLQPAKRADRPSPTADSPCPIPHTLIGIGCYWAILEEAHITLLAIDPKVQGQGLGQWLLLQLLQSGHQRGLERATLEVRISNQLARGLYQKFGFKEAGVRKRYYQDTGEDALVLWRGGLQSPDFAKQLDQWRSQSVSRLQVAGWQTKPPDRGSDELARLDFSPFSE